MPSFDPYDNDPDIRPTNHMLSSQSSYNSDLDIIRPTNHRLSSQSSYNSDPDIISQANSRSRRISQVNSRSERISLTNSRPERISQVNSRPERSELIESRIPEQLGPVQYNSQLVKVAREWVVFAIMNDYIKDNYLQLINTNQLSSIILFEEMIYNWIIQNTIGYISKLNIFILPTEDSKQKVQLFINKWDSLTDDEKLILINNNQKLVNMEEVDSPELVRLKYLKYKKKYLQKNKYLC